MRNLSTILLAVALMLGLAQCKKEQPTPQSEGNVVTITLNVDGNNGSRVNVDPTGENQVTFTGDDQILVASDGKYVGTLTKDGETFSGTVSADDLVVGQPLYFYFLGNKADVSQLTAGSSTTCTVNISDQTTEAGLPVISMGRSIDSEGRIVKYVSGMTSFSSRLYNKCSLMKFNVTTPSEAAICITGMNNKVTVDFTSPTGTDNGFTYDQVDGGLITIPGVASSGASTWAIVLPQAALTTTGGANSVYTTDGYSGVRPTIHAIERNCYYSDGDDDVDLTVETRWFHTFTATLQDYTVQSEPNRAITTGGVKTFAAGETMAIVYKNTSGSTVKVTSEALTAGDISNNNKSATFTTFELENPDMTQNVTYVYPASMVNDDGSINYDALNSQNGTLTSNLDLATYTGAWDGASLPTATLTNQLAILALTLKNSSSEDITNTITRNLLSDGTNSYNVIRSAAEGPIYVAVRPTSATMSMMAQGSIVLKNSNPLTGMTLEAGKIYPINVSMTEAFLADALNEGVKVNVVVKYNNENWSVVEGTYSSGSFTDYVNGDGNGLGTEIITFLSMSMDGGNLIVYLENPYDNNKITFTFNTTDNTYRKVISSNDPGFGWCFKDLKSISINGFDFSNQMTDSDAPVAPTLLEIPVADHGAGCGDLTFYYLEGESWKDAIDNHPTENAGWGYEIGEDTGDPEMPPLGRVFYNYDYMDWDLYDVDDNPIQPEEGIDTDKSYYIGWD